MAGDEVDGRELGEVEVAAEISVEGDASVKEEKVEVVSGPKWRTLAQKLDFDDQELLIIIHPSADRFAEDPVQVSVNGRSVYIWRNQKTLVKRKYVEVLARAKHGDVDQPWINSDDPNEVNRLKVRRTLRYPFSVLHDPSPRGHAWLQAVLSEA